VSAGIFERQPGPDTLKIHIADFAGGVANAKTTDIKTNPLHQPEHQSKHHAFYINIAVGPERHQHLLQNKDKEPQEKQKRI
jgi:hypothetical protein